MKVNRKRLFAILAIVIVGLLARYVILGGARAVSLKSTGALTGSVSQALNLGGGKVELPVPGIDYELKGVRYFDGNTWAVAQVSALKNKSDSGYVVLKRESSSYEVRLGPGSVFSPSYLKSLPADVGQYLSQQGVVNGSINVQ